MCNPACIEFGARVLGEDEIRGRDVLEVGAMDVNGSLRSIVEPLTPTSYVGVDIADGPGVDEVCDAAALVDRFGPDSFDLVLCTEVVEHVREWRNVIRNLKSVVRPGGTLLVTTRSRGFPYHEYPHDYWRYEPADLRAIFADFTIEELESDGYMPGVFMKASKPVDFRECALDDVRLYAIVAGRRCTAIRDFDVALFRVRHPLTRFLASLVPESVKARLRRVLARTQT